MSDIGMLDKVKNVISPESLSAEGIFNNPIWGKLAFFGRVALYMIIALFTAVIVWKFFIQYKVRCTIWKEIGGGAFEQVHEKAKIVTDKQNKKKFQMFKTRWGKKPVTCPIPEARYKNKLGKKDHYHFVLDDNGQLHPMELDWADMKASPLMKIRPQERDAWARQEDKLLEEKFRVQSNLEKYMPAAIVLSAMLVAFLIFFFMSKDLGSAMTKVAEAIREMASVCTIQQ